MVQLPGPRKRRAAAVLAAHVSSLPAPVDEWFGDGNAAPLHKRVKEKEAPAPPPPQDMYCGVPGPLGLRLRKSPSLVELVQMELSRAKCTAAQSSMDNSVPISPINRDRKSGSLAAPERLKASNFPANFLKIGTWEYTSQYEGDLVAKCYYAKRKLVWEFLVDGLKNKIEIQWAHITALNATCPGEGDGTLDLVLARPPLFFKETDPQPRKHTLWQASSDLTGGQASLHRRHIMQCPSTLLSKNFEKLIQCDQRLNQLTQQPVIILDSLIFEPRSSIFENSSESDIHIPKSTHSSPPCVNSKDGVKDLVLQQPDFFAQPMDLDNCMTEQRTTGHEVPSEEFLGIAEYLLTDTHCTPVSDEKYLMARVDSLYNLLEKDAAPTNIFMLENNSGRSSVVGGVDLDDFDVELRYDLESEELKSSPARETADCTEPPAISRNGSSADLLQTLLRTESVGQFLLDIEEYL